MFEESSREKGSEFVPASFNHIFTWLVVVVILPSHVGSVNSGPEPIYVWAFGYRLSRETFFPASLRAAAMKLKGAYSLEGKL